MDNSIETRLIKELEQTNVNLSSLKLINGIDAEIDKLKYSKKKNTRQILSMLITCYIVLVLSFVLIEFFSIPFINGFFKGFLIAGFLFSIIRVYQSRREFDKEIFILELIKENREN